MTISECRKNEPRGEGTHSDFDDFAVETVEQDYDITSVGRRVGSIVPAKKKKKEVPL